MEILEIWPRLNLGSNFTFLGAEMQRTGSLDLVIPIVLFSLSVSPPASADPDAINLPEDASAAELENYIDAKTEQKAKAVAKKTANEEFAGVNFGIGLGITIDPEPDQVDSAQLINGIVRIEQSSNNKAQLMLETHMWLKTFNGGLHGIGPFVAIQASESDLLDAMGIGLMYGIRTDAESPQSLNIGLGYFLRNEVQKLGAGLEANQPLPAGETEIRYRTESDDNIVLTISFTF